ncbi:DNA gyrase subunit A [Leptospira interrogans]|uniref:DNA gyrase/topoisomerase IV, A subunit n=2 Tax=Leptospira interrogans TaxID=173 RepID=A0A0F6IE19_LEPIR|nr:MULTISPECIES: DNA gyrase subunit A [Leptospira]ASV07009.1 DNA gyrase subunit A [Leptospira interrogans serovar Canicola]EJO78839.1 DNA gyrase/topoisomerase IV, A subunit [Leptospira interrogans serovar Pomona str. Kennewicki LC82-25]EKN97849.1 DNA gyrase/topoisomerase IV, A subunit [Leptospira interrogans serovar Pomona str. Pomona]EKO69636.1 DNA gyrase/topoisomerase IV, A subunit [Leptospira interrogans serovar Canicola str. Fiocruz LV133]EKR35705.1 DNA gyrase/topoisomerase IV, A subunit [
MKNSNPPKSKESFPKRPFEDQVNDDQRKYSRYVCDSRAIPHEIDGLKPVQRRILWAMWNSDARNRYTKTVKVAGLAMGYHPHGDKSIQDALSQMAQDFTFANNIPLVSGEGTFGDVLDPSAIASPRYTEVKLSDFVKDLGFFESLPDIDYVKNYDETEDEPIHFVGKVPIVLLNNIQGIATGFRCFIPGHRLADIVKSQINYLKSKKPLSLKPWYKDFNGEVKMAETETGNITMSTTFAFKWEGDTLYLTDSPMNWNREKVISLLDDILERKDSWLKDYVDYSSQTFRVELQYKKGEKPSQKEIMSLFNKEDVQTLAMNVITYDGKLKNFKPEEIIKRFCDFRKTHLIRRFKRLSGLEEEKIERNSELIRFIKEKWNEKVIGIKSKKDFEEKLKTSKFKYFEWLSTIPVYRMTIEEVKKCEEAIVEAKTTLARYQGLVKEDKKLTEFMIIELEELQNKWDKV